MNQKQNQHRKHSTITPRALAVSGAVIAAHTQYFPLEAIVALPRPY